MNVLNNYPEFGNDINDSFEELIVDFALSLSEPRDGLYLFTGEKCSLRFTYDRGDVFCDFKQPHEILSVPGFGVFEVLKFLYRDEKIERFYDPRLQLFEYSRIIKLRLRNILLGDFSWVESFTNAELHFNKIIRFISENFSYHNPISKKMRDGDITWKRDFEEYVSDNNIEL